MAKSSYTAPTSMDWLDISSLVFGLAFSGQMPPSVINSDDLCEPFRTAMPVLKAKKRDEPRLMEIIGLLEWGQTLERVRAVEKIKGADWISLLERASARARAGGILRRLGERLERGEEVDLSQVPKAVSQLEYQQRTMTPLSDIVSQTEFFEPTGFAPLDDHIGGLPKPGLTVIGAPPGVGKTTLLCNIAEAYAKQGKRFLHFSMEMLASQMAARYLETSPRLTKAQKKLILINDEVLSPYEVASIAPRIENAGAVGIDFAELMLKGDSVQSEQTMGVVYVTLATLSKNLGVPVILLSQLNRSYEGTLPKMNMLRYTGLAEAMSSLVLLLYNPNQVFIGANNSEALPIQDGKGYIIVAKSRYGYNRGMVEQHTSVGAIQSDWDGATGWGGESIWFPLAGV